VKTSEARAAACSVALIVVALATAATLGAVRATGTDTDGWARAAPGFAWSFPRDHWQHPDYRTEWWYLTGHLESDDDPPRRFGYQLTIFRVGVTPRPPALDSAWAVGTVVMGHAAITDLDAGRHRFSEVIHRAVPFLAGFGDPPQPIVAWTRAPAGTDARWTVTWNGEGFDVSMRDDAQGMAFELATRPTKPLAFEGPGGLSVKSAGGEAASLYYSLTRLATSGTLRWDGSSLRVRGQSWMDKEFSTSHLSGSQVGWDWFSLQLDDGRELMLYVVRDREGGADQASATIVAADGEVRYPDRDAWSVRATRSWRSPASGAEYPAGWEIELPDAGLRLTVEPEVADQENRSRLVDGLDYWEGAVRVLDASGRGVGRGYVELTGYGPDSRPPV